jgi:hypothetical protein
MCTHSHTSVRASLYHQESLEAKREGYEYVKAGLNSNIDQLRTLLDAKTKLLVGRKQMQKWQARSHECKVEDLQRELASVKASAKVRTGVYPCVNTVLLTV